MAKKKRRRLKKKIKKALELTAVGLMFLLLFGIYSIGQSQRGLNDSSLPKTNLDLTAYAKGIDVSVWQKPIDWQRVAQQGYSFAIIRTSYGWSPDNQDRRLAEHLAGAKAAGLDVGAYHYSHAMSVEEANWEADLFISILDQYEWDYPVYYDMEDDAQLSLTTQERTDIALTFLSRLEEAGYEAGLYANQYWLETKLDTKQLEDYEIWIASYTDLNQYQGEYGMWQYSSKGRIDGISGNVDVNIAYKDYPYEVEMNALTTS
ncbi:MAG TPA: glycoside hydrolase family 25 protein [Candidatus Fimiplasma intestinipullorum]|uniref:Glycoside hydrolase family 25 protein n=1 Tax=Candidatus Fimiplasma intestinipullorum TaxID=2840825 RepID=A0A9D1HQ02_9FIRM|nr:glycoside hydrolase family 25 protein [Candidatus Fimiplasma intestinipullorum]